MTSQSAWSDVQSIKLSSHANAEAIVPMDASAAKPVIVQADPIVVNDEAKSVSAKEIKQIKKVKASKTPIRAAADSEYTEWVREDIGVLDDNIAREVEATLNSYANVNDKSIFCSSQTVVMTRKLKSDETKVQFKLCKFLGYSDVIINFDTNTWKGTFENAFLDMPLGSGLQEKVGAEFYYLYSQDINFTPETKTITFGSLAMLLNDKGTGWWLNNSKPVNIVLPYMNDDFSEWESLGVGTIDVNFGALESVESYLNLYAKDGDETIKFANTTEVMARKLKSNPSIVQYKFCKFLGYDDVCVLIDETSLRGIIQRTNIGIPYFSGLNDWGLYGNSIDFAGTVLYAPIRKQFTFTNVLLYLDEGSGYNFGVDQFGITLPGGNTEVGFSQEKILSGGEKSTDKSITYSVELRDVDHLRYVVKYGAGVGRVGFTYAELSDIISGKTAYKETKTEVTIDFTEGCGDYGVLLVAMDENDKYMGFYSVWTCQSNVATPGTWKSIGRGTWHYDLDWMYSYNDRDTGESKIYYFPTDKMEWEVEIEKLVDGDREVYRVVNPYTPECPLADSFNELFAILNIDYPVFNTDDTYWVEFELCKDGTIKFKNRPHGENVFWGMDRFSYNGLPFIFKDKRLKIKKPSPDPRLDENSLGQYFVLDFPGFRGVGFETVESTPVGGDSNNGEVVGTVGENVEKLLYATIPASDTKPTEAELANIVNDILANPDKYNVYTVSQNARSATSQVELPYSISEASWMIIVPVGNDGVAFDYTVAPLKYTTSISNVSMTETLLSFAYDGSEFKGKFTGLTLKKTTDPEKCQDVYTFPNPYANDPGWYSLLSVTRKDTEDWMFVHDYSGETDNIYFVDCDPGVSVYELFNGEYYLIPTFGDAYKEGDKFYFKYLKCGIEGYSNEFNLTGDQYFVIDLSQTESAVSDIAVEDESNMPVEFYDLQGRRVENPASGLYIRRQGSRVSKVLVK